MKNIGYQIARIKSKILKSHEIIVDYYRRGGVKIGNNCTICSYLLTKEPFLIEIGDETIISTNVTFVTHDNSAKLIFGSRGDLYGKIVIGNNCFIGQNSTILYGVSLADNIIVAAGSVVTRSFNDSNIIIGGNPARVISSWDKYKEKYESNAIRRNEMLKQIENDSSFLVKR